MDTKVDYPHTASDLAKLRIINPIAEPHADTEGAERHAPAARPSSLKGKTVALYWNGNKLGSMCSRGCAKTSPNAFRTSSSWM